MELRLLKNVLLDNLYYPLALVAQDLLLSLLPQQ
jgi:hypothetical protein